jgi:release factor glutamine methyltransferase
VNREKGYSYLSLADALLHADIGDIEACRYEAFLLLHHFAGMKYEELPFRKTEIFCSESLTSAVQRRTEGYPLQYIIGEWQFCNETYFVSPDCLIPRADTEILVEAASALLPKDGRFIDLCTGSGCIAVSLLAARCDASALAVDLYPNTLDVARRNAERNSISERIRFACADVLKPHFMDDLGRFDMILSNPPYISEKDMRTLSREVLHEPHAALYGGEDGLVFYRMLISEYPRYLNPNGKMILEIGYDQASAICSLADAAGLLCEIHRDYGNRDRMAILSFPSAR